MELPSELISQFARITNDKPTVNEGSTVYATYRLQGESAYVQIDGSDVITPVATTAGAKSGDRVTVLIKNHRAIVTGNLTDPSANTSTVENLSGTVGGLGTLIDGAARVATDYIEFKTGTGLIVGNQANKDPSGNIIGSNVLIHAQGIDIRNGSTILAQYTDDYIYLGYNSNTATIDLCNGLATISNQDSGGTYNRLYISGSDGISIIGGNSVNIGINGATARFVNNAPWESNSPTTPTVDIGVARVVSGSLSVKRVGMTATKDLVILGSMDFLYGTSSGIRVEPITGDTTITGDLDVQGSISGYAKISDLSSYYTSGDNIYANKLYVQGAGNISGDPNARLAVSSPYQLGYASGSSRNFKHDIKPVENEELDPTHLYDIEVVQFKYNDDYLEKNDQRYGIDCIGFIAEQVNDVYPIAADRETGEPRNWEMRYMIPPMLALIQQQKKKIDDLETRINKLESKGVA